MSDPFARAQASIYKRLGVAATLRGAVATSVILDKDVAVSGIDGELIARRDMASLPAADNPRIGDTLTVGATNYVLDSLERNDGDEARFWLRKA